MIALTEQGQCLADEMWAIRQRQMRETFARLPAEDRARFGYSDDDVARVRTLLSAGAGVADHTPAVGTDDDLRTRRGSYPERGLFRA